MTHLSFASTAPLADEVPDLFGPVPPTLFVPLASPNASLYWKSLARFYQYEFEEPTHGLVRPTAIELCESVIRSSSQWRDARDSVLDEVAGDELFDLLASDDEKLRSAARRLVERLERSGWFHFEYQSRLGEVLNFYPYAARILDPLLRIARDEQPVLQGYAISILQAVKPDIVAVRPGWAIMEAREKTAEFVRELKLLNRNIYDETRRLLADAKTASGVLEDLLTRYQRRVMGSFHRLKTVDNPFRHRGEIFLRLDAIETDEALLERAAAWYAEERETDTATAEDAVRTALRTVRMQLETLPDLLHDIDARNSRFSGAARNKLVYLLSRNRHIDGQLQALIDGMVEQYIETLPFDVFRSRFLREDFLYVSPVFRTPAMPTLLAAPVEINTEQLRARAKRLMAQPYGERAIRGYVASLLGTRPRMSASEVPVTSDDDYVRFICVVTYGSAENSPFRFTAALCASGTCPGATCDACHLTRGPYRIPNGIIERTTSSRAARSPQRATRNGAAS